MSNNVQITAGSGTTIETIDEGGGVERQVVVLGSIGDASGETQLSAGQQTSANSIPVVLASDQSAVPVTANAGTDLNTSALALESGGNLATLAGTVSASKVQISGTVTANAGTNLNTSTLALESGGNLATLAGTVSASKVQISGTVTANAGTDLNTSSLALESGGNLATLAGTVASSKVKVDPSGVTSPVSLLSLPALAGGNNNIGAVYQAFTSASGFAIAPVVSASTTNVVGKSSAGNLYEVVVSIGATAGYVYKFNATSMPSNGSVTAGTSSGDYQDCVYIPPYGTYSWSSNIPESFSTGITIAFSSTGPGTFTSATANFLRVRVA